MLLAAILLLPTTVGCVFSRPPVTDGQLMVHDNNHERVWEKTVDVVHDYFFIERENHFDHVIETEYKVGSGLLEPWQRDSAGFYNRLESSLQSIRRKAFVHVVPVENGHLVSVQVYRELEDVPSRTKQSPGGATFRQYLPLQRELEVNSGPVPDRRWIPVGRDSATEQAMLRSLQSQLSR